MAFFYKEIFDDFINLVNKINGIAKNKGKILLRYLPSTKSDIENYFFAAQNLVEKSKLERSLTVKNTAMFSILKDANVPSDIVDKKVNFFDSLSKYNILEDDNIDFEFTNKENHRFNISSSNMMDRYRSNGYDEKDFDSYIKILNTINSIRKGNNSNSLENIGAIFLTAKSALLNLAWDEDAHENESDVPLVTSIDFMINRFWFKTQNSISETKPRSFDVALQAKLIVGSLVNTNFIELFDRLKCDLKRNPDSIDVKKIVAFRDVSERILSNDFYVDDIHNDLLEKEIKRIERKDREIEELKNQNEAFKELEVSKLKLENDNKDLNDILSSSIVISKNGLKRLILFIVKIFILFSAIYFLFKYDVVYYFYELYEKYTNVFNLCAFILAVVSLVSRKLIKRILLWFWY